MGGALGEVPLRGNGFYRPCCPGPAARGPRVSGEPSLPWGRGTVWIGGAGRIWSLFRARPHPHARVALGAVSLRGPGAPRDHPRTRP